ncbi:MAG: threonylcarbamoyl-AMP synthase [Devosiaceae bacterium]|nr:threonylcarbamoyl-AMP synthase [Devosiaceae bacterium]
MKKISNNIAKLSLSSAIELLAEGEICAFPTDTVYGLGARADNGQAIKKLFEAKKRPVSRAIILLCADLDMAKKLVEFSSTAKILANYWPGALTLVLPLKKAANIARGELAVSSHLGVRVPASNIARQLISGVGQAVATTSANISGNPSTISAEQVIEQFDGTMPVLDDGQCIFGEPSTILKVDGKRVELLRAGPVLVDDIEQNLGFSILK